MDTQTVVLVALAAAGGYLFMQNRSTTARLNDTQGALGLYRSDAQRRATEERFDTPEERQAYTDYADAAWRARYGDSTSGGTEF
jgi:hypothetical protein